MTERESFARWMDRFRIEHAEQRAQIVEMALRATAFLELAAAPLGDEIVRGHAHRD